VPHSDAQPGRDLPGAEVLTLAEAAAYLRAPEGAVLELVDQGTLPAQRIGGEWRFLKRAVVEWLHFRPHLARVSEVSPALDARPPLLGRTLLGP
jgi:excisionase family DNA binding protein